MGPVLVFVIVGPVLVLVALILVLVALILVLVLVLVALILVLVLVGPVLVNITARKSCMLLYLLIVVLFMNQNLCYPSEGSHM